MLANLGVHEIEAGSQSVARVDKPLTVIHHMEGHSDCRPSGPAIHGRFRMKKFLIYIALGTVMVFAHETHAQRSVSGQHIQVGDWIFIPTLYNGGVETFLAFRTDVPEGENLTSIWFVRQANNTWRSYGWTEQDRAKASGYVKTALLIPSTSDVNWKVTPVAVTQSDFPPDTMVRGVFVDDPFADVVGSAADPGDILDFLVTIGWSAARIDIWSAHCASDVVLNTYALAVEATEIEMAANGGTSNHAIASSFANTVTEPCGGGVCALVVKAHGQAVLIAEGDLGSVFAMGLVPDAERGPQLLDRTSISRGQVLIQGWVENTGTQPATLLLGNGESATITPGQQVVLVETDGPCTDACQRIIGWVHDPGFGPRVPSYCIEPDCYCCCWANMQPDPPTWVQGLPACPCQLALDQNGNPINPDPTVWGNPHVPTCCHPGAAWCIRSDCPSIENGPGQQCCYDASGNLITVGEGAGTPDMVAPCGLIGYDPQHIEVDVTSFRFCKMAGMLDCYLRHRPPNNGTGCACNPPNHPQCTQPPTDASCPCD